MKHAYLALLTIGFLLTSQVAAPRNCLGDEPKVECNGKFKGGGSPLDAELKEILQRHAAWVKDLVGPFTFSFVEPKDLDDPKVANDPRRANLCGATLFADLRGANLAGADLHGAELHVDLSHADLTGADLRGTKLIGMKLQVTYLTEARLNDADLQSADLRRANLAGADLRGAYLALAHLDGAHLENADLRGAGLNEANLRGADLGRANLSGADLSGAGLSNANLTGANLSKAKVARVDMTGAIYAPSSEPPDPYVAGIKGLATVNAASGEEIGPIQLRKLLQDAALRDSAREATFSIQRALTKDQLSNDSPPSAKIVGYLRTVGLEWTTGYGLHPERALRWILLLGAVLTPVYMFAALRPTAASGVMQVFPADRLEGTAGNPADEEKRKKQLVHAKSWRAALRTAAYFSLISAVNIGFEQFTPGDWIRRLQTQEYSLEAVGWVRVVAGVQALLSVYLLAMWALTQFGQLFE
jgi:uncharacterized protein YjbI with pentapeptide repeats